MTIDESIEFERYLSKQPEICNEDFMKCEEHKQIAEWLEELKQYRKIGTVEEFKALKEKSVAKKQVSDIGGCIYNNVERDWDFCK